MKKIISIFLLILIFLNVFGFNLILGFLIYKCKTDFSKSEFHNSEKISLLKIHPSEKNKLQWEEEDEFKFKGKMYDVIKKIDKKDTLFIYCINDDKEDKLFELFFKVNTGDNSNKTDTYYVQENIIKNFILWKKDLRFFNKAERRIFLNTVSNYNSPVKNIDYPPPQIFA